MSQDIPTLLGSQSGCCHWSLFSPVATNGAPPHVHGEQTSRRDDASSGLVRDTNFDTAVERDSIAERSQSFYQVPLDALSSHDANAMIFHRCRTEKVATAFNNELPWIVKESEILLRTSGRQRYFRVFGGGKGTSGRPVKSDRAAIGLRSN